MQIDTTRGKKLEGLYRGNVLRHLQNGKLKVFIPGVYDEKYNSFNGSKFLPDCELLVPAFGGNKGGVGIFSFPHVGSKVICQFLNGDQNSPIVLGMLQEDDECVSQYQKIMPHKVDSFYESGDDSRIHTIVIDQARINIFESGEIDIIANGDRKASPDSYSIVKVNPDGSITIQSTSQVKIDSPNCILETQAVHLKTDTFKVDANNDIEMNAPTVTVNGTNQLNLNATNILESTNNGHKIVSKHILIDAAENGTNAPSIFIHGNVREETAY